MLIPSGSDISDFRVPGVREKHLGEVDDYTLDLLDKKIYGNKFFKKHIEPLEHELNVASQPNSFGAGPFAMLFEACTRTERNLVSGLVAPGSLQQHLDRMRLEITLDQKMPMCDICKHRQR
eukprot:3189993-Prorocentrum_lima.AAC.1